jgi:hypothetical protein
MHCAVLDSVYTVHAAAAAAQQHTWHLYKSTLALLKLSSTGQCCAINPGSAHKDTNVYKSGLSSDSLLLSGNAQTITHA